MENQDETIIVKNVNTSSVEESNLFLRRLWSEISGHVKNGWLYQPYRNGNTIFVGNSNIGTIKFDYKKAGCINNIYIKTNQSNSIIVRKCLERAISVQSPEIYVVNLVAELSEGMRKIKDCSYERIAIYAEKQKLHFCLEVEAYSKKDLEYLITKKKEIIQDILFTYTNEMYIFSAILDNQTYKFENSEILSMGNDMWIDLDEIPMEDNCIVLSLECLQLLEIVRKDNFYDLKYQLLFNSARQFYCANKVWKWTKNGNFGIPGYVDIVNSIITSALEPLSSIICDEKHQCRECGNMVYSIAKRIRKMLEYYLENQEYAKQLSDRVYGNRSKFFHEGYPMSTEVRLNLCWPQINPISKNEMLMPCSMYEYNLADIVSYVFRRIAKDLLQNNLPMWSTIK